MSRSSGSSRYPSAYGHTPSYRSAGSVAATSSDPIGTSSVYPSALAGTSASSLLSGTTLGSFGAGALDLPSGRGLGGRNESASKYSSNVQSSSYSSSSVDGARPKVEWATDSAQKSVTTGASGIPHTSYGHSASSYSNTDPYKNRLSSYSYNI